MNDSRVSVDYRRDGFEYPTDSRQLAHMCECGEPPAFLVTVSQPLVGTILGPEPVCMACMPGMNQAVEALVAANSLLLVDVRAWS